MERLQRLKSILTTLIGDVAHVAAGVLLTVLFLVPTVANAGEIGRATNYIGKKIYTDSDEYNGAHGFAFTDENNRPLSSAGQSARQPEYLIALLLGDRPDNRTLLIAKGHNNEYGHSDWLIVHDAIDIPQGLRFIGSIEEPCKDKRNPLDTIFVVGRTANIKTTSGDSAGGDMYQIRKAWRVDFTTTKLVGISIDGVSCIDKSPQPGEVD